MPLIRTVGRFGTPGAYVWLILFVVGLPLFAFLILDGLVYEAFIRMDSRRRLPSAVHWIVSVAVGTGVVFGLPAFVAAQAVPAWFM